MDNALVVFGPGYCGAAILRAARAAGYDVVPVGRDTDPERVYAAIAAATHAVSTVPPGDGGDPVLNRYGADLRVAPRLVWVGYLSTTGVYGDRGGDWVDETTVPAPGAGRSVRRLAAEQGWAALEQRCPVDLLRLAGIYGPGRSAFEELRAGRARRVVKPGHAFGRIHRDDVARLVLAAMRSPPAAGVRVLHGVDDEPAESADVMAEAARLLNAPPPPAIAFADAARGMSPMALSFWAEDRKVSAARTKAALGLTWRYPTYREGLRAILAEERVQGLA